MREQYSKLEGMFGRTLTCDYIQLFYFLGLTCVMVTGVCVGASYLNITMSEYCEEKGGCNISRSRA